MKIFVFIFLGVILGSIKGGISFSLDSPEWNSTCYLRTDSSIVWVVGDSGQVARYAFGENSVANLIQNFSLGERYKLNDVFFWDEVNGWVVGCINDQTEDQGKGVIWRTVNGGQSWYPYPDAQLPPILSMQPISFIGIEFKTPGIGFVYCEEGYFLKTTDGGSTWVLSGKHHMGTLLEATP